MTDLVVDSYRFAAPPSLYLFEDDWTGTNGDAWNASKWTERTAQNTGIIDIQANSGRQVADGGAYSGTWAKAIMTDVADVDISGAFTLSSLGENYPQIWVRGSGTVGVGGPVNGYTWFLNPSANQHQFQERVSSSSSSLGPSAASWTATTAKQRFRFQVDGSTLRARVWADGAGEPGTWDSSITNVTIPGAGFIVVQQVNGSGGSACTVTWDDFIVDAP